MVLRSTIYNTFLLSTRQGVLWNVSIFSNRLMNVTSGIEAEEKCNLLNTSVWNKKWVFLLSEVCFDDFQQKHSYSLFNALSKKHTKLREIHGNCSLCLCLSERMILLTQNDLHLIAGGYSFLYLQLNKLLTLKIILIFWQYVDSTPIPLIECVSYFYR